jgi:hypothetical protein
VKGQGRFGVYRAIVTNADDPASTNRIKIKTPSLSDDEIWAEVAIFGADDRPPQFAIGGEVVVAFEGGAPSQPIILGKFRVERQ